MPAVSPVISPVAGLVMTVSTALLVLFLGLTILALLASRGRQVPARLARLANLTHGTYGLALALGLLGTLSGMADAGKFWEYMGLFVGGGVLYSRGVLPGGWVHKILTDPPNVPWGLALGSGWNFAAVLGYLFMVGAFGERPG